MTNSKALNLLGLAMRAGKLITGEELAIKAIRNGKAKCVIVGVDASENTKKKIQDKCVHYKIPYSVELSQEEISNAIGRKRTICAFVDQGFAKSFQETIKS